MADLQCNISFRCTTRSFHIFIFFYALTHVILRPPPLREELDIVPVLRERKPDLDEVSPDSTEASVPSPHPTQPLGHTALLFSACSRWLCKEKMRVS